MGRPAGTGQCRHQQQGDIGSQQIHRLGIGAAVRPKERREVVPDGPKIGQGKDDPAKDNQQQGIEALHHTGGFLQRLLQRLFCGLL